MANLPLSEGFAIATIPAGAVIRAGGSVAAGQGIRALAKSAPKALAKAGGVVGRAAVTGAMIYPTINDLYHAVMSDDPEKAGQALDKAKAAIAAATAETNAQPAAGERVPDELALRAAGAGVIPADEDSTRAAMRILNDEISEYAMLHRMPFSSALRVFKIHARLRVTGVATIEMLTRFEEDYDMHSRRRG